MCSAILDSNSEAAVEFRVGLQPGNNYRVAASLLSAAELESLQSSNATLPHFVSAYTDRIGGGFAGTFSPLLTVWRKLHIEVDSMEAVATNGEQKNFEEGSVVAYQENVPALGQSTLGLSIDLIGSDHQYENGRIEIAGYDPTNVVDSIDRWEYFGEILVNVPDNIVIIGTPGVGVVGQAFRIYDDDDRFLLTIGLPPALPKDGESTNIVQGIRSVFVPAYLDVTDANAEGLNPNRRIAFRLNEDIGLLGGPFTDAKDVFDGSKFWAHTVVFGYQPEDGLTSGCDRDPNTESPVFGVTREQQGPINPGVSVIYAEVVREAVDRFMESNIARTNFYPDVIRFYEAWMYGITAHEAAHYPGRQSPGDDHAEDGLMHEEGRAIEPFWPATIKRFRKAPSWSY